LSDENAYERDHPYDNTWHGNPYAEQTEANTNTNWLDDQKPVDVDPDGLTGYAKSMLTIQGNVTGQLGDLSLLGSTPSRAWATRSSSRAMRASRQAAAGRSSCNASRRSPGCCARCKVPRACWRRASLCPRSMRTCR